MKRKREKNWGHWDMKSRKKKPKKKRKKGGRALGCAKKVNP
jgi:hypothetical protein